MLGVKEAKEQKEVEPSSQGAWQSFMQKISNTGEYIYRSLPIAVQKLIKERQPTAAEKQLIQQLTDEELREFGGDFSKLKGIIQARKNQEAKDKHAMLEKAKADFRRDFDQPRLKNAQGLPDREKIAETIEALKPIYQPGTVDYEAFHAVVKEMGFE